MPLFEECQGQGGICVVGHFLLKLIFCQCIKVDGAYAAVKFPTSKDGTSQELGASTSKEDPSSLLQDCRLLRKDELSVSTLIHLIIPNKKSYCFHIMFILILLELKVMSLCHQYRA